MANLPAKTPESSDLDPRTRYLEALADQVVAGHRPDAIARRVYPDDHVKRRQLRSRLWRIVRRDANFHAMVAERARGELVLGLGPASRALAGRAGRGRVDAIKLIYEASGFHNAKVQHQHTGEIKISLDIPRPTFEGTATDAEVVE